MLNFRLQKYSGVVLAISLFYECSRYSYLGEIFEACWILVNIWHNLGYKDYEKLKVPKAFDLGKADHHTA